MVSMKQRFGLFLFRDVKQRGFTLIELLVSISVMLVILGISTSQAPQALVKAAISDDASNVELLFREAQIKGSSINSLSNVYGGAGMHFDRASATQAILFKDKIIPSPFRTIGVGNGVYNKTSDELLQNFLLRGRDRIGKLCVATSSSLFYCNETGISDIPTINTLTVSFTRPKQTAHVYINNQTGIEYQAACVELHGPQAPNKGYVRSIQVYRSGMITKNFAACN